MEIRNGESAGVTPSGPALSKNQLKKLKRDQEWEAKREIRKQIRKQKVKEKKIKKRAARDEAAPEVAENNESNNNDELTSPAVVGEPSKHRPQPIQLPVTIVIDCGFDELMQVHERKSLGSQVTRCYSDIHKAPYQVHLVISSFGGHLKERFDTLLLGNHRSWKNVRFLSEDFTQAAKQATEWMQAPGGGELAGALASTASETGEVVYLTSDSPDTLSCLRPYSTYIIGGIVDKNRHKGICYKKAMEAGVKTAKLPIGDYMQMNSRFVLATNHVSEIMVRWLECGDWGEAFEKVMPKRKGGVLKQREVVATNESMNGHGDSEITGDAMESPTVTGDDSTEPVHVETEEQEPNGEPQTAVALEQHHI